MASGALSIASGAITAHAAPVVATAQDGAESPPGSAGDSLRDMGRRGVDSSSAADASINTGGQNAFLADYYRAEGDVSVAWPDNAVEELRDFVHACVRLNAEARPTVSDLLEHPFVKPYASLPVDELRAPVAKWLSEQPALPKISKMQRLRKAQASGSLRPADVRPRGGDAG